MDISQPPKASAAQGASGEYQVRHGHRGDQAEQSAERPQGPVDVDGGAQAEEVLAEQQGAGADGQNAIGGAP